jgi:hypothetical protein
VQVSIDHLICSDMAPSTAATEFRATLGALNITQTRIARLFNVTTRHVRRWQHGERNVPHTVGLVVNLLAAGVITVSQAEAAAPAPARTNGRTKSKPPAPVRVEPEPEQSAVARAEVAAFVGLSPAAAAVVALDAKSCHWPLGDPQGDFCFCADPVVKPPYCEHHRKRAYLAPRTGSERGVRVAYGRRLAISGVLSATGASRPPISRATLPVAHSRPLDREASPC